MTIQEAKQAAVAEFLTTEAPAALSALAVSTLPRHNVTGIGYGPKIVDGRETGTEAVRFYVERKVAAPALPAANRLPEVYQGHPTDVIESGRFRAGSPATLEVPQAALPGPVRIRLRPAQPGCSVGFQFTGNQAGFVMAGTFGAVVTDGANLFVLSNNHVLANENDLPPGSPIFQPGLLDGGDPATDQIAALVKFIRLDPSAHNLTDCAIARVLQPALVSPVLLPNIGRLSSPVPVPAAPNMSVEKTGRTSGYTQGTVFDVHATVKVTYSMGELTFDDQVLIRGNAGSFSAAGDSGSLIVDAAGKRGTALLFAGSAAMTIANKLENVLAALGVTLVV